MSEKWWIISAAYLYDSLWGHFNSDRCFVRFIIWITWWWLTSFRMLNDFPNSNFFLCVWLLELYPRRDPPNPIVRCVPDPLWAVTMCFAPGVKCAREGYPNRESNMAMDGKSPIHTVGVLYGFIMGKTNMGTYGKIMENQSVHEGW